MTYSSLSCDELVRACAESGNAEAWQEFICRFGKLIELAIWRVARRNLENSSAVVEELVQDTYAKICADDCRFLRNFKAHHEDAFFGMLKVTAANVARDYFRAQRAIIRGSGKADSNIDEVIGTRSDPKSAGPAHLERQILLQQIDRILSGICGGRDREIFWLHYRQGFAASAIAEIPGYKLTVKGVESILHRLRSEVRSRLAEGAALAVQAEAGHEGISENKTLFKGEGQL